jgi:redox-sensitive bicupin YhaK (pirin superfamily)
MPNVKDVTPRYGQISLDLKDRHNQLQQIISPNADDDGLWIHQNAWFHLGMFDKGFAMTYQLKNNGNGLYIFNLQGNILVNEQALSTRDGYGVWNTQEITITAETDSEFLMMEVPMSF